MEVDFSPLRRAPGANDDLSRSADETVAGFQAVRIDELLGETATVSTGMEATSEGQHTGTEGETRIAGDNDEEEDGAEEELLEGDLRDSPIWRLPVNSRVRKYWRGKDGPMSPRLQKNAVGNKRILHAISGTLLCENNWSPP